MPKQTLMPKISLLNKKISSAHNTLVTSNNALNRGPHFCQAVLGMEIIMQNNYNNTNNYNNANNTNSNNSSNASQDKQQNKNKAQNASRNASNSTKSKNASNADNCR